MFSGEDEITIISVFLKATLLHICQALRRAHQLNHFRLQLPRKSLSRLNFHISSTSCYCKMVDKEDLRKRLTPLQYQVTQEKGTERPFTGCYNKTYDKGTYVCICCEQPLFTSDTKYDSGCGWPAFNDVLDQGKVKLSPDTSGGRIRTEVTCSQCDAHLGHVFGDGPPPTGKRFCINSASINFIPGAESAERALKVNPKNQANFCSLLCFWYTLPTFRQGWHAAFNEEDLYEITPEYKSRILGDRLEQAWEMETQKTKPSLFKALLKVFFRDFFRYCFILISAQMIRISQAVCVYFLIEYYEPTQTTLTKVHSFICVSFLALSTFILVICMHRYMLNLQLLGMKIRIASCTMIYRKCLRLSRKALENTTIGQTVNLLTNDVIRFDFVCLQLPYLFDIPIEVGAMAVIMHFFTSTHSFFGIAFFLLNIPLQLILGKRFSKIRRRTTICTDGRVQLMSEIISGMQVIKMHTWEESFTQLVHEARRSEIKQIRLSCYIKSLLLSLAIITNRVALFVVLVVLVLTHNALSPPIVFIIVALFAIMRQSMTVALPAAIAQIAEARVSLGRMEQFLLKDEFVPQADVESEMDFSDAEVDQHQKEEPHIVLERVYAKWTEDKSDDTLSNITLSIGPRDILVVIGMVGCGKTSFLNLLLHELRAYRGKVDIKGTLSYAHQEPWLFVGTVKDNILFGSEYNYERYNKVLVACALKRDLSLLPFGDDTIVGERGVTLSGGQRARINLARAIYKEADIYLLDDPFSAVDPKIGNLIYDECINHFLNGKCVVLATHQLQYLKAMPLIMILQSGAMIFLGPFSDISHEQPEMISQLEKTIAPINTPMTNRVQTETDTIITDSRVLSPFQKETINTGSVKRQIYLAYMAAGGNVCASLCLVILFVGTQVCASATDYFISYWLNVEQLRSESWTHDIMGYRIKATSTYVLVYTGLISSTVLVTLVRSLTFFTFCMRASANLHKQMFYSIINAPMSFFDKNPSGRILNRFSKDMGTIDDQFPFITLDTLQIGLSVLGIITVTLIINPFMVFPIVVILAVFYFLRVYYLRTSRNIKRLEAVTRSPVYTQISTSIQGLSTIRAFKMEQLCRQEFETYQDTHTSAWELFLSTSRAFGFALDFICCLYISIVAFSFISFTNETYGANVGLALTQSLALTGMFQWGMRQWSEMENCMTSVERVYEYTKIQSEQSAKPPSNPPPYWPNQGAVDFKHVFLKYSSNEPYVLRDLSFNAKPSQKIGIVGRSGAGKSSIIASLFQLADTEGQIIIDDIDIQTIPLKRLRSEIAIIPQEPVLFAGTLRQNLDPFQEHSDSLLWKAIEEVALLQAVLQLPLGLYTIIYEGGSNFSVGQRQLLCLARAIVRSNRILVLDEATANVDHQTDQLIQTTIKDKFRSCTVLTIAHRLHTILDSDKVLVMEAGNAKEFGYSYILLQDLNGIFYSLVESTGPRMQQEIMQIAKENYFLRKEKGVDPPAKPLEPEDSLTTKNYKNDHNEAGPSSN